MMRGDPLHHFRLQPWWPFTIRFHGQQVDRHIMSGPEEMDMRRTMVAFTQLDGEFVSEPLLDGHT